MKSDTLIIIQARRGSTRLPDKVLMQLSGKPLLIRMYERVFASEVDAKIIIATTTNKEDDIICEMCDTNSIEYFRGHPTDLLDRHYNAAKKFEAKIISKIPSDCPLIDPKVIKKVFQYFFDNTGKFDFVSNLHPATYPDGNDVEVFTFDALETAHKNATKNFEREHTTPYIWENPEKFRIGNVEWESGLDYSKKFRFTIDYPEDYEFIKNVYDELYPKNNIFGLDQILNLLKQKPGIYDINKKYLGEYWYKNHLDELKNI
ncbi:MAG: glycosyltransferase family protein [Ignavibacteria bacterium]|nr:glycosyltransferase family protein [Ignavibacteria bacterium]